MARPTKKDKWFLIQGINDWIRGQTGNPNDGLTNAQVLPLRDVRPFSELSLARETSQLSQAAQIRRGRLARLARVCYPSLQPRPSRGAFLSEGIIRQSLPS